MAGSELQIRMLGEFSLRNGACEINDGDNRSRKVWLLLAYMVHCRARDISMEEYVNLLWGDEESSSNPLNALKTMLHRVRTMLDQLGPGAGHHLIIRREGSYAWNPQVSLSLDTEEFEALCKCGAQAEDDALRLQLYQQALALYQGDFLPKLSMEVWTVPLTAYYHNLYVQTAQETLHLLEGQGRAEEAVQLCRQAVVLEPYNETLYRHLMQNLLSLRDVEGVVAVYEEMSELLFSNFGVMPEEETRALYRKAVHTVNDHTVSLGIVREQLKEANSPEGALFCEYDFFKVLYHAEARAIARNGDAIHIGLLSVTGEKGLELSKRSLERCMENLETLIRASLRKGDIFSRCSVSQYILMLPQANYENSCMVCDRIVKAFFRQYPHSPAELSQSVQPLEPNA
ncbi:MAG: bacterial transcriptional activator domain-containing protein [Oscillibacter sp.]